MTARPWFSAALGALLAVAAWAAFDAVRDILPVWLRFLIASVFLVFGPGAGLTCRLLTPVDRLARVVLAFSFGIAFAPAVAHVLGLVRLVPVYPYLAAALMGTALGYWRTADVAVARRVHGWWRAPSILVLITICVGSAAFVHRMETARGTTVIYGEYDTYDLTYYAAIEAELTHTIPPASPFFSGRLLNHSFYPHVVLALVHRFGGVPTLDLYFRYAWPAFLTLAVLGCFLFVRLISGPRQGLLAAILFGLGSDLSYMAGWFFKLSDWDDVIWSQNFQGGGAEVLLYNNWTPALIVMFAGLYALHVCHRLGARIGWAVVAGACFAVTVLSKPWIFAAVFAALCMTVLLSWRDERVRRRLLVVASVSLATAVPLLYRTTTLFDDAQVTFAPAFFPIPLVMVGRLTLRGWFLDHAGMLGATGAAQAGIAGVLAAPVFLVGSLGYRLVGLPALWQRLRHPARYDPTWRVLAWTVVAASVAAAFIVSVPYHETTQIHQLVLFLLAVFVAERLASVPITTARAAVIGVVITIAVPSTLHYVHRKWADHSHPFADVTAMERPIVDLLQRTDPESTVVLHARPNQATLLGILAERRSVLSWGEYVRGSEARRNDVEYFFASADGPPARAFEILRTYRPTLVLEYRGRDRINANVLGQLDFAFSNREMALYRVPERLLSPAPNR